MRLIWLSLVIFTLLMLAVPIWAALMFAAGVVMPWLLAGLLVWTGYVVLRGPRHRRWNRVEWQPGPAPLRRSTFASQVRPVPSPRPMPPPAPAPPAPARQELPIDVQVRVEQIRRKVDVLLSYASRFPPFSKELYLVRQTASEYLPRTVDAYLALSPVDADRVVTASGKTALQELKDQLDLLDSKLNDIAEDLQRQDVDRLLANRRFLEERFGHTRE